MDNLASISTLDNFIKNPGLQHLAKEIFWNLNSAALEICQKINQSSSKILEDPFLWLQNFVPEGRTKKIGQRQFKQ